MLAVVMAADRASRLVTAVGDCLPSWMTGSRSSSPPAPPHSFSSMSLLSCERCCCLQDSSSVRHGRRLFCKWDSSVAVYKRSYNHSLILAHPSSIIRYVLGTLGFSAEHTLGSVAPQELYGIKTSPLRGHEYGRVDAAAGAAFRNGGGVLLGQHVDVLQ